ncbi:MAG: hypothetical protein ACLUVC_02125 [Longibaculum sp.]
MNKEILNFNGKEWVVMLTRKAMIEIEQAQKNKSRKIAQDDNTIEVISRLGEIESIQKKIEEIEKMKDSKKKEEKLSEYMKEYLPLVLKAEASDFAEKPISQDELIFILIRCNPRNPELTKVDYEKGLFELEEKYGIIELEKKFRGIYNNVFREIDLINKTLGETDQVENTEKVN